MTSRPPGIENDMTLQNRQPPEDEINLIDLIYPIYKRRRFLYLFCILITLGVGVITFFLPKSYESTAVILPESMENDAGSGVRTAFLEQFGIAGIGGSRSTPSGMFEALLNSSELAWEVLKRYDYFSVMGIDRKREKRAAHSFADSVNVTRSKTDPTISVKIESHNPVLSADLANTYVKALDEYNRINIFTTSRRLKEYIEKRIDVADKELDQAQKELREFQEKNRAISISKQAEATLEVLAAMEARRVDLEVQIAAKEKFYKGPHREIEQLDAQMEALQKNIDRLTYSKESSVPVENEKGKVEFYIPLTRIPRLNFDESKLLLNVKAKTGVMSMLTTQLEQAKLDEAKDMPTINILDSARPPEEPVKPSIKLNVILGFIVSLFLGIFLIFFMEFTHRMDQDPESAPKWHEIKRGFRRMIPFVK